MNARRFVNRLARVGLGLALTGVLVSALGGCSLKGAGASLLSSFLMSGGTSSLTSGLNSGLNGLLGQLLGAST